jgi:alanine dehydrogenase
MSGAAGARPPVIILSRRDVAELMAPADYFDAVEAGFRALHEGRAELPPPWHFAGDGGAFHGKGASLRLDRLFVALKLNGNFPANPDRLGLPTVQGVILLFDGETGSPLAIMDSIEVTLRRTAAATALAARYLARPDSSTLLVCGCGDQAPAQVEALRDVLPITRVLAFDRDRSRSEKVAADNPMVKAVDGLHGNTLKADIIVTATTATSPFLAPDMIRPGTFIAAVGADAPHKSEVCPSLMARALIVTDSIDQCAAFGDLRHAIEAGALDRKDVHADLAEIVAGTKSGRTDPEQITLFDSTGTAVQDVASAVQIYQRAVAVGKGTGFPLAA